jgi:putative aldouronate transport system permease protein
MKQQSRMKYYKKILINWRLYVFLIPGIVFIVLFAYVPMAGIQLAFKNYDYSLGIWGSPWTGFDNLKQFFGAYNFSTILWNTISLSFYGLIAGFPLPILLALVLNAFPGKRYKKIVQSVSYMPHFISTVVIVGMMMQIFNPRTGSFGFIYQFISGGNIMGDVFASPEAFPHLYVWSGIWQSIGWSSIIYIAALSSVDEALHEAAQIDGASRFQRVISIDLPSIMPTAVIMLILAAGGIMNIGFEKTYLMQNMLNVTRSEVISTYVYKVAMVIGTGNYAYSTAIGLFNSIVNFTMLISVNYISKRVSEGGLW